jgi:hypothetical protein
MLRDDDFGAPRSSRSAMMAFASNAVSAISVAVDLDGGGVDP